MLGGGSGSGSSSGSSKTSSTSQPSDVAIAGMVRESFMSDSRVSRASISVNCRQGMVQLGGSVGSYEAREAAEKLAMSVDGVRGVENRITVNY